MLLADILGDSRVHFVSRDSDRSRSHDAAKRQNRNISRSSTDIDDHVPIRRRYINPCSNCGRHGFLDDIRGLGPDALRGIDNRSLLSRCNSSWNRDQNFRTKKPNVSDCFGDEVAKHRFGNSVIGDDPVLHGPMRDDGLWSPAEHFLCFRAHCQNFVVIDPDGNNRRLLDHYPFAGNKHERVGRA